MKHPVSGQARRTAFVSPFPDIHIPAVPLGEFVLAAGKERRDAVALVDAATGRTLTYGGLLDGVRRLMQSDEVHPQHLVRPPDVVGEAQPQIFGEADRPHDLEERAFVAATLRADECALCRIPCPHVPDDRGGDVAGAARLDRTRSIGASACGVAARG